MSILVKKVYDWPKLINDIIDEAEKQHREERYVIERKIIKRKQEFDKIIAKLSEDIYKVVEYNDMSLFRTVYPVIMEFYEKVVLFGQDKDRMQIEDQIMFGYKNSYENYEKIRSFFMPFYELWSSINDFCTTTKAWNS